MGAQGLTVALLSSLLLAAPGAAQARSFGVSVQGGYVNANFRNVPDPGRVVLEGRYDLGLADTGLYDSHSTYSGAFSILAGYTF